MLVLRIMEDQSIVIDLREFGLGLVNVTCIEVSGGGVRLGFAADKRIKIDRKGVFKRKERQSEESAQ